MGFFWPVRTNIPNKIIKTLKNTKHALIIVGIVVAVKEAPYSFQYKSLF
jgi:hypothetical protein